MDVTNDRCGRGEVLATEEGLHWTMRSRWSPKKTTGFTGWEAVRDWQIATLREERRLLWSLTWEYDAGDPIWEQVAVNIKLPYGEKPVAFRAISQVAMRHLGHLPADRIREHW